MNRKLRKKMQSLQPNIPQATGESKLGKQAPDQLQISYHISRKTIKRRIKKRKEEKKSRGEGRGKEREEKENENSLNSH